MRANRTEEKPLWRQQYSEYKVGDNINFDGLRPDLDRIQINPQFLEHRLPLEPVQYPADRLNLYDWDQPQKLQLQDLNILSRLFSFSSLNLIA